MKTYTAAHLYAYMREILSVAGGAVHIAEDVAEILIGANLAGHDSHGVLRIPSYLQAMEEGRIQQDAEPSILQDHGNTVVMDGNQAHGLYACKKATELAIERAKDTSTCIVTFKQISHIGRLGHYMEMAAHAGCIGFLTVGSGSAGEGSVLPYGSNAPTFGTNPIAWGIPTGDDTPFILDYATSIVAEGKLRVARSKGLELADGTIVDKDRKPTNNPLDFYDGGALRPFGAHKGSALLMLPCLLGSLGGNFDVESGRAQGCFLMMLDVSRFLPLEDYQKTVRTFLDSIKATEPADGFDRVWAPGDFETHNRKHRLEQGIEVPERILEQLQEWNKKLGVHMDKIEVQPEDEARCSLSEA